MTALEALRKTMDAKPSLFGNAILELADRLDALAPEKPQHAPCVQCGNEAIILGKYVWERDGRILCWDCAMKVIDAKLGDKP